MRKGYFDQLSAQDFQITDDQYGKTLDLLQCQFCNFIQADESVNVLTFYKAMQDPGYEADAEARKLQS